MAMDHLQPAFGEVRSGSAQRRSPARQPRLLTRSAVRSAPCHSACSSQHTPAAWLRRRFLSPSSTKRTAKFLRSV